MGASQQKTDTKQTTDTVKKPTSTPVTVAQGVDFSVQNADPETLQRALAKSNGSVQNSAVSTIQRRYGNQVAQRMIAGTVQQRAGNDGGHGVSRVSKSGPSGQPGVIQRDSDDVYGGMEVGPGMESAIMSKQGSGRPLDDETRGSMESTFGADFGGVRVHHDAESDALNQSVGARSFTVGQDIFFGEGEYKPGTSDGDRLIAHELTHTIQQTGGAVPPRAKMEVSKAGDEYEQEADEEQAQADYEALTAREEELRAQREGIITEAQRWIDTDRATRQAILAELEARLTGEGGENETEEEEETPELEAAPA